MYPTGNNDKVKTKTKQKRANDLSFSLNDFSNDELFDEFLRCVSKANIQPISFEQILWSVDAALALQENRPVSPDLQLVSSNIKALSKKLVPTFLTGPIKEIDDLNAVELGTAIQFLGSVVGLEKYATKLESEVWLENYRVLADLPSLEDAVLLHESPAIHQLLFAEIPFLLGSMFPQLDSSAELISSGRNNLAMAIEELLDGEGLPAAQWVSQAHLLLASWTRCQVIADATNTECLDVDAQTQFEYFVRQSIRLTRKDGSLVFSAAEKTKSSSLISAAINCYNDEDDQNIAKIVFAPNAGNFEDKTTQFEFAAGTFVAL